MKLGIDISQIVYEGTGVGRFTHDLTKSILDYDHKNDWTFFFSSLRRTLNSDIKSFIKKRGGRLFEYKLPPTILSFLWNDIHRMKIEKLVGKQDWFITSDWNEGPSHMKKATIVHDLVYLRYPETIHPTIAHSQKKRMHWVKKESSLIFADSQSTKQDMVALLNIDEAKIQVNYPGIAIDKPSSVEIIQTLQKYHLKNPFVLSVGKIEPRKNMKRLIEAFKLLKQKNIDLVIVGHQGWDKEITKTKSEDKHIKFLSYIGDRELSCLYGSCELFVYPSLYEGFGFPILEAMKLGAAVATSNVSSLREIAGNAGLLFDPIDTSSMAQSLMRLLNEPKLKQKIIKQGIINSKKFTWKSYYQHMIGALKNNY